MESEESRRGMLTSGAVWITSMGMDNASPTKTPKYVEVLRELALCTFENRAGRVDNPQDRHNDAPFDGAGMLGEMQLHISSSSRLIKRIQQKCGLAAGAATRWLSSPSRSASAGLDAKMEEALAWAMGQPRGQAAMLWVTVCIERDHEAALAEAAVRSTCERCAASGASLVLYSAQEAAEAERHNGQRPTVGACLVLEVADDDNGICYRSYGFKSFEADGAEIR